MTSPTNATTDPPPPLIISVTAPPGIGGGTQSVTYTMTDNEPRVTSWGVGSGSEAAPGNPPPEHLYVARKSDLGSAHIY